MSGWLLGLGIIYLICLIVGIAFLCKENFDKSEKIIAFVIFLTPVNILFFSVGTLIMIYERAIMEWVVRIVEKMKIIKNKRKNKKLFLKYKSIDPYGEEDWTIE